MFFRIQLEIRAGHSISVPNRDPHKRSLNNSLRAERRALSSIRMKSLPISRTYGRTYGSRVSSRYLRPVFTVISNAVLFMSDHMQQPVCYQDLKTSVQNYIHHIWQETWDKQILNKLHSIHPSTAHWASVPVRRHDVRLTRLRIGHTRLTHRHLLLGESSPVCDF
ncbi:RNase H domain-containing protein [Trichonephila clavipes]|nr:RNase H domain-containing protein [Trichonephila clavipes]